MPSGGTPLMVNPPPFRAITKFRRAPFARSARISISKSLRRNSQVKRNLLPAHGRVFLAFRSPERKQLAQSVQNHVSSLVDRLATRNRARDLRYGRRVHARFVLRVQDGKRAFHILHVRDSSVA